MSHISQLVAVLFALAMCMVAAQALAGPTDSGESVFERIQGD